MIKLNISESDYRRGLEAGANNGQSTYYLLKKTYSVYSRLCIRSELRYFSTYLDSLARCTLHTPTRNYLLYKLANDFAHNDINILEYLNPEYQTKEICELISKVLYICGFMKNYHPFKLIRKDLMVFPVVKPWIDTFGVHALGWIASADSETVKYCLSKGLDKYMVYLKGRNSGLYKTEEEFNRIVKRIKLIGC